MTPFEGVTGEALYEAEKRYSREGGNPIGMEYALSFLFILCSIVLEKPVEFFQRMPATDVYHLKYWVGSFLEGTAMAGEAAD